MIARQKANGRTLVPEPTVQIDIRPPSEIAQERMNYAIKLVNSGYTRKQAAIIAHVAPVNLRAALKDRT